MYLLVAFFRNVHSVLITEKIVENIVYVRLQPKRAQALFNPREAAKAFRHLYTKFIDDTEIAQNEFPAIPFNKEPVSKSYLLVTIARKMKNPSNPWEYLRMIDDTHAISTSVVNDRYYPCNSHALASLVDCVTREHNDPENPIAARGVYRDPQRLWWSVFASIKEQRQSKWLGNLLC